jgi:hypothetical protein
VRVHDPVGDGEPEPGAFRGREERIEDARQVVGGDARAVVRHGELDLARQRPTGADLDAPLPLHRGRGVQEEVDDDLLEARGVAVDDQRALEPLDVDRDAAETVRVARELRRARDDLSEVRPRRRPPRDARSGGGRGRSRGSA